MHIDFEIKTEDTRGMNLGDWFEGGWRTIDRARLAPSAVAAERLLSRTYRGADPDGVEVEWTITERRIEAAGYAVEQVGYVIFGVGETPEAAVADACEWLDDPITLDDVGGLHDRVSGRLRLMPASAALIAAMRDGSVDTSSYDEIDGVLLTLREAYAVIEAADG